MPGLDLRPERGSAVPFNAGGQHLPRATGACVCCAVSAMSCHRGSRRSNSVARSGSRSAKSMVPARRRGSMARGGCHARRPAPDPHVGPRCCRQPRRGPNPYPTRNPVVRRHPRVHYPRHYLDPHGRPAARRKLPRLEAISSHHLADRVNESLHALMNVLMAAMLWNLAPSTMLAQIAVLAGAALWFVFQAVARPEFKMLCAGSQGRLKCVYHSLTMAAAALMIAMMGQATTHGPGNRSGRWNDNAPAGRPARGGSRTPQQPRKFRSLTRPGDPADNILRNRNGDFPRPSTA